MLAFNWTKIESLKSDVRDYWLGASNIKQLSNGVFQREQSDDLAHLNVPT